MNGMKGLLRIGQIFGAAARVNAERAAHRRPDDRDLRILGVDPHKFDRWNG
ncbi:hypothetical protein [Pleomorphomonas carboxyditropha]|uniref:hypothetical protein n=1 Tax=Pleomorphomonas carboxyditropha TaxID=2023338 RepID=UPI0013FE292F|nr:hypothetical protein [Pleomorphomonas carboxyditropha]